MSGSQSSLMPISRHWFCSLWDELRVRLILLILLIQFVDSIIDSQLVIIPLGDTGSFLRDIRKDHINRKLCNSQTICTYAVIISISSAEVECDGKKIKFSHFL